MKKIRELIGRQQNDVDNKKNQLDAALRKRIRMQVLTLGASVLLVVVLIFAMTAAWFTNVAKTSNLVFQTESWGFDADKIKLSEDNIPIAPGSSGIVPLSIDNSGETDMVQIGVTISKAEMDQELQKRIFFYVDTVKTNTFGEEAVESEETLETMSKVYLGASAPDTYAYTILPGQILTMNELFYNDVPIKWEWVYDMVGYYFKGTVDIIAENQVAVDEYIRPIEYDYEQAVFETDENSSTYHQLKAVGNIPTKDFLKEISSSDGYEGEINDEQAVAVDNSIYYPVEIDENGYGVWAYLCTLEEIEAGIAYDTELASSEEPVTAEATIILTAVNMPTRIETVNTEAALIEALADDSIDIVQLDMNVSAENTIVFEQGKKIIDLNNNTLQYDGIEEKYALLTVEDGAELTVINGEITGTTKSTGPAAIQTKAIDAIGGNVVLSDVKISGFDTAVYTRDMDNENGADSSVQIFNSDLETAQVTVVLMGNGDVSEATTKVIIQNSTLTSKYYTAINGQGNEDKWGTELIISNSTVNGYYAGIYQPQRMSSTKIIESKITGNTGIAIKGGNAYVYNSEIIGTGAVAVDAAGASGSGFIDTGDAVYVEAVYDWSVTVVLEGEENIITSDKAYAVELFGQDGKGPGKVMISDGTFTGAKGSANWNEFGTFEIYGGNFKSDVNDTITRYDIETTE